MQELRVAIAEDEPFVLEYLVETVQHLGHQVVAVTHSGDELVLQCETCRPQVVITDIKMPGRDGIEAALAICQERPVYVIFLTGYDDEQHAAAATRRCVRAVYLVKPVNGDDLGSALSFASTRLEEFDTLLSEAGETNTALKDRDAVESARTWLMQKGDITDHDAFLMLRRQALELGLKVAEMARTILPTEPD